MGAVGLLTFDQSVHDRVWLVYRIECHPPRAIVAPDRSDAPGRDVPDSLQPRDGCNLCSAVLPGAMVRSTADESTTPEHSLGTAYSGAGHAERFTRLFALHAPSALYGAPLFATVAGNASRSDVACRPHPAPGVMGDITTALHLIALEQRRVFSPACHRIWMPCVGGAK